ncbi:baeRF7 domain-containing protein [Alienimonas californiensis]|uniref:Uncharacterized protein n=1 Tax=Alienimonas californiensis TaxID=2527989 RepID=A0A517PCK6_9PLAN|nr:hypothetical protein [Alienimonas californiensis]QDT17117.1 hypothetical protein CA12_32290 [Alienimonas californiensis]
MNVAPIDPVTRETVRELAAPGDGPRLTLTMPTHRSGAQGLREDAIRFKNLLGEAERLLKEDGVTGVRLQHALAPLHALRNDERFWQHQAEGLALFLTPPPEESAKTDGQLRTFRLSHAVPERVALGDRFEVLPLVPLVSGEGRFFVLAVSQNHVRLLEGTRAVVLERNPEALPQNLREALNIDEYQSYLGWRSNKASGVGGDVGGQANFHGHGAANQSTVKQQELTEYFRRIGAGLEEFFRDPTPPTHSSEPVPPGTFNPPVVFAGVDYLFPMLKEAWNYPNLLSDAIHGNVDALPANELHAKAWPLAEAFFQAPADRERTAYSEKDPALKSDDLSTILEAARSGRVETLFVAEGERAADPEPPRSLDPAAVNLLSVAAGDVVANSGRVFVLPRKRMPGDSMIAATFRYPRPQEANADAARTVGAA